MYEGSAEGCRGQIEQMLWGGAAAGELPERIVAGVVPHAGWVFSGELAAMVFGAMKGQEVETLVVFGAVHSVTTSVALLYDSGQWGTPLGIIEVDEELSKAILQRQSRLIRADRAGHAREHSIEVQVPIIQYVFPESRIVPVMVPPIAEAPAVGQVVAEAVSASGRKVVYVASTDLTHYGPSYYYTPMGSGAAALRWAKETNDRHFIDLALKMEAEALVDSAQTYQNACGAGAVAAAVAAAKCCGATKGYLLGHRTSAEIMPERFGKRSEDSVGYAAIVYG